MLVNDILNNLRFLNIGCMPVSWNRLMLEFCESTQDITDKNDKEHLYVRSPDGEKADIPMIAQAVADGLYNRGAIGFDDSNLDGSCQIIITDHSLRQYQRAKLDISATRIAHDIHRVIHRTLEKKNYELDLG